jgi:hypothetical protein
MATRQIRRGPGVTGVGALVLGDWLLRTDVLYALCPVFGTQFGATIPTRVKNVVSTSKELS